MAESSLGCLGGVWGRPEVASELCQVLMRLCQKYQRVSWDRLRLCWYCTKMIQFTNDRSCMRALWMLIATHLEDEGLCAAILILFIVFFLFWGRGRWTSLRIWYEEATAGSQVLGQSQVLRGTSNVEVTLVRKAAVLFKFKQNAWFRGGLLEAYLKNVLTRARENSTTCRQYTTKWPLLDDFE